MKDGPVTYRRLRAAAIAADDSRESTRLTSSTELSLPKAADYVSDYMRLERRRAVRLSIKSGMIEIGPERRLAVDRRLGADRRVGDQSPDLWVERRVSPERRSGIERRLL